MSSHWGKKKYCHENQYFSSKEANKWACQQAREQTNKQASKTIVSIFISIKFLLFLLLIGIPFVKIIRLGKYLKTAVSISSNFAKVYHGKVLPDILWPWYWIVLHDFFFFLYFRSETWKYHVNFIYQHSMCCICFIDIQ